MLISTSLPILDTIVNLFDILRIVIRILSLYYIIKNGLVSYSVGILLTNINLIELNLTVEFLCSRVSRILRLIVSSINNLAIVGERINRDTSVVGLPRRMSRYRTCAEAVTGQRIMSFGTYLLRHTGILDKLLHL